VNLRDDLGIGEKVHLLLLAYLYHFLSINILKVDPKLTLCGLKRL
jgi:hypothetical protein